MQARIQYARTGSSNLAIALARIGIYVIFAADNTGRRITGGSRNTDQRTNDHAGTNFTGANFSGADLGTGVDAVTWSNVTCPDGTNSDTNGNTRLGHLVS